jgi:hypothetical protein
MTGTAPPVQTWWHPVCILCLVAHSTFDTLAGSIYAWKAEQRCSRVASLLKTEIGGECEEHFSKMYALLAIIAAPCTDDF